MYAMLGIWFELQAKLCNENVKIFSCHSCDGTNTLKNEEITVREQEPLENTQSRARDIR